MSDHTPDSPTLQIQTPSGHIAFIDEIDADLLDFKWHAMKSKETHYVGRSVRSPKQTTITLHTVILERKLGRPLVKGEMCDHKDLDGLNNRRSNLRLATVTQNMCNRGLGSNNKTGYKGVYWSKMAKKWQAKIGFNRKQINLGSFENIHDAARAYNEAAIRLHGEFARLNEIPD